MPAAAVENAGESPAKRLRGFTQYEFVRGAISAFACFDYPRRSRPFGAPRHARAEPVAFDIGSLGKRCALELLP